MLSVTSDRVVEALHASQAAPAAAFKAKTLSFVGSTITLEPSGSCFSINVFEFARSTCIVTSLWAFQQGGAARSLALICVSLLSIYRVGNLASFFK